jgi:hypothetical protein
MNQDFIEIERIINSFEKTNSIKKIDPIDNSICTECNNQIIITDDGIRVCSYCGIVQDIPFVDERQDPIQLSYTRYFANKKYNRFKHLLRIIRKINCSINAPDKFNAESVIHDYDISNDDDINTIKHKIKNFKINQYTIINKLNPKYAIIDNELISKIKIEYLKISSAFNKLKLSSRRNILNNYFILKKILIRLGRSDIAEKIHNLKLQKNILNYENIWNQIEKLIN